jgi:hypothetical protein
MTPQDIAAALEEIRRQYACAAIAHAEAEDHSNVGDGRRADELRAAATRFEEAARKLEQQLLGAGGEPRRALLLAQAANARARAAEALQAAEASLAQVERLKAAADELEKLAGDPGGGRSGVGSV